jgi:hypothetical protein
MLPDSGNGSFADHGPNLQQEQEQDPGNGEVHEGRVKVGSLRKESLDGLCSSC